MRNQLKPKQAPPPTPVHRGLIRSAADAAVWKKITLGTFASPLSLREALDAVGCNVGGLAGEILARPTFTVSTTKGTIELFAVSPEELGFDTDTVRLAALYARARQLGFELATAEVAPQLRLQYFEQPMGEFLIIGMEPIKTWSGAPVILNVANGGAGLLLIGQDGLPDAEIPVTSRFVFLRGLEVAPGRGIEDAAALSRR
ncbi:hypothetical protein [Bradyrhizobium sp. USDA 3315]